MIKGEKLISNFMEKINVSVTSLTSGTSSSTTPNGSTNALASAIISASNSLSPEGAVGSHVRRLSVPLQQAGKSGIRRFSHLITMVNQTLDHDENKGEKNAPLFGGNSLMNREWEIVTVDEMCRRLSLEDALEPSEMPLPEGATSSQMLDEFMIRQVCDILPARAEGYPWINVFSSDKNGFSLSTFYRKMAEFGEEMSPILLLIRDTRGHVFGAVVSTPIQIAEHYYGTGDSCILFRFTGEYPHTRELRQYTWTGANQFFINATKEYLSIGAGQGYYGLWLDADLNIGRSQKCATFDNELLAGGESEEFVVQFIEAFGFAM